MSNEPLVSIVIPSYNASKTIANCLQGVLDSDYKNIEIIVVDDGSTDNTKKIVESFKNVLLLAKTNGGSASAKNFGAQHSRGELIYFLDSDVVLYKNTISMMLETITKYNVDMVSGRYSTKPLNHGLIAEYKALVDFVLYLPKKMRNLVQIDQLTGGGGEIYTKKSYEACSGFNEKYKGASVEREELFLRFSNKGYHSAGNPMIRTKHTFPNFKTLIKNYTFRIYATISLLRGKKYSKFSYISKEKAILAPFASIFSIFFLATSFFFHEHLWLAFTSIILFLLFSREVLIEAYNRKGLLKAIQIIIVHFIVCFVIGISGIVSTIIVNINETIKSKSNSCPL